MFAQDLAFIAGESKRLARGAVLPDLERLARVADHAFVVSRLTIRRLVADPGDFAGALRSSVAELADRGRSTGRVTIEGGEVPQDYQDDVLRIVGEATVNAVRHGHAEHVSVDVVHEEGWTITVTDDGDGFATDQPGTGFGMTSMRERAIALGGDLDVSSEKGRGTTVSIHLP
ncbi:MAG: rane protein of unknown function [Frankiales bacterium]|nr:rane protein of unknown function [Frankiales bacterium]